MPTITPDGGSPISCFKISGTALPQQQRIQTFGITGVDGVGVHLLGMYGEPSTWTLKHYGTHATLQTWYDSISTKVGEIATIVNDEGEDYPNQLIEKVPQPQKQTAHDGNGSTEIWTVQLTTRTV